MDSKTPKAQYLDWLEKKHERARKARLENAMHTTALALEVARDLDSISEHLPAQIEPELAKAVMEVLVSDARENAAALHQLMAALRELPDSQNKEIALRRLQLVGQGLPFDGLGGAADEEPEEPEEDAPGTLKYVGGAFAIKSVNFPTEGWTIPGGGGGAAHLCGCPRCNPRRRA